MCTVASYVSNCIGETCQIFMHKEKDVIKSFTVIENVIMHLSGETLELRIHHETN